MPASDPPQAAHTPTTPDEPSAPRPSPAEPPAWWARLLSRLPLPVLYAISGFAAWLAFRVVAYRAAMIDASLARAFPELDARQRRAVRYRYYRGFAQMFAELLKAPALGPDEIRRRVRIVNLEEPRALLARGQPVLLVAAHQGNWEWMLLALSLDLGYPLDAAYKPLVNEWAEREMKKLRTRFGTRLVPAQELLADIIRRRGVVRAVAMVADQEPARSERRYWTRFLNRDTAFYMGPEEIARVTQFPVFFITIRRRARGYYEMEFLPLARGGKPLPPGTLTERYAHLVEEQIRAAPPDWPWSHKRWRLKKSVYQ
ncbi:MAG TPA: lysophospholipid acyltransferase family protein [Steroidobacteraceae bacterium]|nr:lysophospholipid acyltransferase family protein [Steroidobacteraceae bacterium]